MKRSAAPTMKTVAKLVGVSEMTVSRALRNHPEIKKETREKILEAAERIGYRPNPLVSALMTQISSGNPDVISPTIALVNAFPRDRKMPGILSVIREEATRYAESRGFRIEEFFLDEPNMTPKRLLKILEARGIHGLIFEPFPSGGNRLRLNLDSFSCVEIGQSLDEPSLNRIKIDEQEGIIKAIENLRAYGYQRIGFADLESAAPTAEPDWKDAISCGRSLFVEALRVQPLHDTRDRLSLVSKLEFWIRSQNPDVIVSPQDWLAKEIEALGRRIPGDIGFVHLNCDPQNQRLAGIDQNWKQRAIQAVKQVVGQLKSSEYGVPENPIAITVKSGWIDGPSLVMKRTESVGS